MNLNQLSIIGFIGKNAETKYLADRLVKGAHVFVQGELTTREYDRLIKVPTAKGKSIEHVIQQLVVELKAETIRTLDRSPSNGEQSDTAEPYADEVSLLGASSPSPRVSQAAPGVLHYPAGRPSGSNAGYLTQAGDRYSSFAGTTVLFQEKYLHSATLVLVGHRPVTGALESRYAHGMKTLITLLLALGLAAAVVSAEPPFPIPPTVIR